jgi:hypothetical protein
MKFERFLITCQDPKDSRNIQKEVNVIRCSIDFGSQEYHLCIGKAQALASKVNEASANDSTRVRQGKRRINDSIMGVLAEEGWLQFINLKFGPIASYTEFVDPTAQIDIRLQNGHLIEIRSSYVRNGVKFGICNDRYNFKNIGPYSNSVKPGEIQKNFYLAVLFEIPKSDLLIADPLTFYLVGGSTWSMMEKIGYDDPLIPYDDLVPIQSTYKVIQLKNALDPLKVLDAIQNLGYAPIT